MRKDKLPYLERLTTRSYAELLLLWLFVNVGFAIAYFTLSSTYPLEGPSHLADMPAWDRLWNSLYFSIITGTSTGYGDIVPLGMSKFLSVIQVLLALLLFAIFVTKLVTHRQETATLQTLEEVEKILKAIEKK